MLLLLFVPLGASAQAQNGNDKSVLIGETLRDGTPVLAGDKVAKKFILKNAGSIAWIGRSIRSINSSEVVSASVPNTKPGETCVVTVRMRAPNRAGIWRVDFQMLNAHGDQCFPDGYGMWSSLDVKVRPHKAKRRH